MFLFPLCESEIIMAYIAENCGEHQRYRLRQVDAEVKRVLKKHHENLIEPQTAQRKL